MRLNEKAEAENAYVMVLWRDRAALLDLLDWQALYRQCRQYRTAEGYTSLHFDAADLRRVIEARACALRGPDGMLDWTSATGRERVFTDT